MMRFDLFLSMILLLVGMGLNSCQRLFFLFSFLYLDFFILFFFKFESQQLLVGCFFRVVILWLRWVQIYVSESSQRREFIIIIISQNIQNQLMKSSYNRLIQKPRTAQISKKNSSISSVLYKQIGETLKQYKDTKIQTRRDRASRNSNNNIHQPLKTGHQNNNTKQKQNGKFVQKDESRKQKMNEAMPFTQLNNNYMHVFNMNQEYHPMFDQKKSVKNIANYHHNGDQIDGQVAAKTSKKSFQYKYIIGKGGFGKVWKVEHNKTRNQYAMKQMLKSLVMTKKSVQSVMNERLLLSGLSSPFIVNMHYAFQDRDTLYLVLDLLEGGDLRHHISTKRFSQLQAKFFISCIVLGLEYLHNNKIIHRDIKPENIVLDSRGYVRITDLGIARIKKSSNSCDTSGTPGYMSPQVICRMNHSYVSDYYALGVIAYEMATGRRPHNGFSRNEIREQILAKQASIKLHEIPEDWSEDCIDFINRLLQRKPEQRLGFHGADELKNHPWIKDLNWKKLASRDIQSPFVPLMKKSDFDQDQQITIQDQQEAQMIEKNSLLLRKPQFQQLFKQYFHEPSITPTQKERQKQKNEPQLISKSPTVEQNRRKNSAGSYHANPIVSVKNSCANLNLKKTNVSTNNSIQISGNISGNLNLNLKNGTKTPQITSRNVSGSIHNKKNDISSRHSKGNVLNVSECVQNYGLEIRQGRGKDKEKERPFFRH